MKVLMSSRPRRGSCSEYCRRMSGAASSSTIPRLQVGPQNSVNQRPTMALFSCSFDMVISSSCFRSPGADVTYATASRKLPEALERSTPYLALEFDPFAGHSRPPPKYVCEIQKQAAE